MAELAVSAVPCKQLVTLPKGTSWTPIDIAKGQLMDADWWSMHTKEPCHSIAPLQAHHQKEGQ